MQPALVVSVVAVAISLVSLMWQFARARWERPIVIVSGWMARAAIDGDGAEGPVPNAVEVWEIKINVSNVGDRAVTVLWVGLALHGRQVGLAADSITMGLPIRVEPHDHRSWTLSYPLEGTRIVPAETEVVVRVVQRPSWVERRKGIGAERSIYAQIHEGFELIID